MARKLRPRGRRRADAGEGGDEAKEAEAEAGEAAAKEEAEGEGADEGAEDEAADGQEQAEDAAEDAASGPSGPAGWKGFCTAFASIMARAVEKPEAPVLCETQVLQKIKEKKAEAKERHLLSVEQKATRDQGYTMPDITQKNFEMQLRKIATQGVVRLFNTLQDYKSRSEENQKHIKMKTSEATLKQRSKRIAQVSQEAFEKQWKQRGPKAIRLEREAKRKGGTENAAAQGLDALEEFA